MNHLILKNLTFDDMPKSWVQQFNFSTQEIFTIHIIVHTKPDTDIMSVKNKLNLMRTIEQKLNGVGNENSEEWINEIKVTRTISKIEIY